VEIRRTFRPFRSRHFRGQGQDPDEPVKWGLRSKLIAAFVIVAVLPIIFLGVRSIRSQRRLIRQQIYERNLAMAELIAKEVDNTIQSATRLLENLVTFPRVRLMDLEETQSILDKLVTRITEKNVFRALCLVDNQSEAIINTGVFSPDEVALSWYLGVVQGTHLGYESPVHQISGTDIPVVTVVRIVRDHLYKVVGVLVGDVDLSYLEDLVDLVQLEKTGYAYLVNENGRIIVAGSPRESLERPTHGIKAMGRVEEAEQQYTVGSDCLSKDNIQEAIKCFKRAIELNPAESRYETRLADGYLEEVSKRGNEAYLDAFISLEHAVNKNPNTHKGLEVEEAVRARRIKSKIDWRPVNSAVRDVLFDQKGMKQFIDYRGDDQLAVFASTRLFGDRTWRNWGVIVQQTASEAFAPVRAMMWRVVSTTGIAALLAAAVGVLLALSITGPLAKLVRAVQTVSAGDLNQEINIETRDELADLADNFNLMRENLRDRMEELNILYRVGQTMSSELDYDKLLYLILEEVIQVMGAEKGSLMLLDEDTGKLVIRVAKGLEEDIIKGTRIAPGQGIVGQVVQARKAILVENTLEEPGFKELKGREVEPGTLLSVPLMVRGSTIGVVNVSKSIPGSFGRKDLKLFAGLANQAAIALENAILYKEAITDGLTQLFIHRYFQRRLDQEMRRAGRYGSPLTLTMLDIDHFKSFNDKYGHQVGDRVLKVVAELLANNVRNVDIVARYGGEEFAVISPEKTSEDFCIAAERLRKAIEEHPFEVDGERVQITISLGIATFPEDAEEKHELIEKADMALYQAKETGRNRFCCWQDSLRP